MARRQVVTQLIIVPGTNARSFIGRDIEGIPASRHRTLELVSVIKRKCQVARCVTFAAMRQRLGDIGAPVPFWALRGVGLKPLIFVEERRPKTHHPALVERNGKRVLQSGGMHGRQAEQISPDRKRVQVGHIGV